MRIVLTEDKLMCLIEAERDDEEVTFFKFFTEVKNFLKKLLDDPIDAKPSSFFKEHGITRSTLLNKMLDRNIIKKKENIDEPNDADGNAKSTHYIQYSVPRKNFEQKIKRLYSYFFENGKKKKSLNENFFNDTDLNSCAAYIFCNDENGELCVLAGKRRGSHYGGLYNVPTGHFRDHYKDMNETPSECAARETREESGINIPPSMFKDIGDEYYKTNWGMAKGKNLLVILNGTTTEHTPGIGDGENDRFTWIPISKIDIVPWAFNMDKTIMQIIEKYI